MRLRLRCSDAYSLGDHQYVLVAVPGHLVTVGDFSSHVFRLLELGSRGGGDLPQFFVQGFLVSHCEELRALFRDDEVVDVQPGRCAEASARKRVLPLELPAPHCDERPVEQARLDPSSKKAKRIERYASSVAPGWVSAVLASGGGPKDGKVRKSTPSLEPVSTGSREDARSNVSQVCELFVGGLHPDVDDAKLREHFAGYGPLKSASVVTRPNSRKTKCYGFVAFADPEVAARALAESGKATICGKSVDIKPRSEKGSGKGSEGREAASQGGRLEPAKAPSAQSAAQDESSEEGTQAAVWSADADLAQQMAALGLPTSFADCRRHEGEDTDEDEDEEDEDEDDEEDEDEDEDKDEDNNKDEDDNKEEDKEEELGVVALED